MSEFDMGAILAVRDMKPEFMVQSCQNALLPIMSGIAAIGDLMTIADRSNDLDDCTMDDVGCLLKFLANLACDLRRIEADAQTDLRVSAGKKAKAL